MVMNTTRELARIITAADRLPEPARSTARAELWTVQLLTPAGQVEAIGRWRACMHNWPTASVPSEIGDRTGEVQTEADVIPLFGGPGSVTR